MINLNGCWVSEDDAEFISDHKGEIIYSVDERDELFTDLDEAKEYAATLLDDWAGEMNISEYRTNISYDEDECEYKLDNSLLAPLVDTGRYWTLAPDGHWHEMPDDDFRWQWTEDGWREIPEDEWRSFLESAKGHHESTKQEETTE